MEECEPIKTTRVFELIGGGGGGKDFHVQMHMYTVVCHSVKGKLIFGTSLIEILFLYTSEREAFVYFEGTVC